MARGTQFIQLIDMVRAEVEQSTNPSVGIDYLPSIKRRIVRVQESLYDEYDWPFLRIKPIKLLQAGSRFYDFPTDLNLERVEEVSVWYNDQPCDVERGIDFSHYAQYDSEATPPERSDPVLRWDVRWTGTKEQIEVWPVPASDTMRLQFVGIRNLRPLVSDNNVADLDDTLITLFVAAEILAKQESSDAQLKANQATARHNRLKGRVKGASAPTIIGGGRAKQDRARGTTIHIANIQSS